MMMMMIFVVMMTRMMPMMDARDDDAVSTCLHWFLCLQHALASSFDWS